MKPQGLSLILTGHQSSAGIPPYPRSCVKLTLMSWLGSSTLVDVEGPPIICSWDGKVPPNPLSWLNDARTTWLGSSTYTRRTDGGEGTLSGADTVSAPIRTIRWTWVDRSCPRETLMPGLPCVSPRRLSLWGSYLSRALPLSWQFSRSLWLRLTSLLPCLCPLGRSCLLPLQFWLGYGRYLARSRSCRRSWRRLSASEVWSLWPPSGFSLWRGLPRRSSSRGRVLSMTTVRPWCSPRNREYLSSSLLPFICQTQNRHPAHHSHTIS